MAGHPSKICTSQFSYCADTSNPSQNSLLAHLCHLSVLLLGAIQSHPSTTSTVLRLCQVPGSHPLCSSRHPFHSAGPLTSKLCRPRRLSMVSHRQTRQVAQNARPPVQGSNALDLAVTAVSAVPMSSMLMVLLVGMGPSLSGPSCVPLQAAMTTMTTNCLLTAPARRLQARQSSAKINFSYSILFHLTISYSSYFGGKKGISRNKTSFFLLMMPPSISISHLSVACMSA